MEGAEDRPRTMYCKASKNLQQCRPNLEGYPDSVAAVPADETLPRHSFIHGQSPVVAVCTSRRAHAA
jgi:hypothetical protein